MRSGLVSVLIACGILCSDTAHVATPRTNVVLILTDDMGFSDLGCYGGEIDTGQVRWYCHLFNIMLEWDDQRGSQLHCLWRPHVLLYG
jgi:hypothetical protein